jgi:hydrogenase/urease accessory protein HupE
MKLCLVALLLFSSGVQAHEIGTSRVAVLFHDGQNYDVEVVTDANALNEKLTAVTGSMASSDLTADQLQARLVSFDETFRRRVRLTFDDKDVQPSITYSVSPAEDAQSAPGATIHLKGAIPPGAKSFVWNFGWTFATYAFDARSAPGQSPATQWVEGGERTAPVDWTSLAPAPSRLTMVLRYLRLGFTHIVPNGLDHMLFVLGIYFLSRRARSVLLQVSAFTVAHSITLALSLYGIVAVSPSIVEPMIALSIAYVAIENVFLSELKPWRVALVFGFGLLHGLGFAGALRELDLPRSEFATALVAFNVGVEAGQLAVICAAFVLIGWYCAQRDWYRTRVAVPASLLIACTALYWMIERIHY